MSDPTPIAHFDATPDDDETFATPDSSDDSPLADVREQAAKALSSAPEELAPISVDVPSRPGFALVCDPNLGVGQMQFWQKRCRNPQVYGGIDMVKLAATVLANQTRDVTLHGKSTGWTFRDGAFWRELGAKSGSDAVRRLFGARREALLVEAAEQVLAEAGLEESMGTDEVTGTDPTDAP